MNTSKPHHQWRQENTLDELVTADNVAQVVKQWTGIPVQSMLETESEKLLRMEDVHQGARHRAGESGYAALADAIRRARSGLKGPEAPDRIVHLPGLERRRQNRIGEGAGGIHV